MENIDIQNVVAKNTGNAIFIRRGHRNKTGEVGTLRGVYIANVKAEIRFINRIRGIRSKGLPDHLNPGADKMPKRPPTFTFTDIHSFPTTSFPHPLSEYPDIRYRMSNSKNIEITYGGRASKDIAFIPLDAIGSVPENEAGYPEFSMFGELPAWGFYLRHAEGIKMINVKISYREADFRPAMVMDDVKDVDMEGVTILTAIEMPVIFLNNTSGVTFKNLKLPVSEEKRYYETSLTLFL